MNKNKQIMEKINNEYNEVIDSNGKYRRYKNMVNNCTYCGLPDTIRLDKKEPLILRYIDGYIVDSIYYFALKYGEFEFITIPDSITKIYDCAFEACIYLKKIELPDSVIEIGHSLFYGCESIEEIKLSNNITIIDECTFMDCKNLKKLTIPDNIRNIKATAFNGCESLVEIIFRNQKINVKYIDNRLFIDNESKIPMEFYKYILEINKTNEPNEQNKPVINETNKHKQIMVNKEENQTEKIDEKSKTPIDLISTEIQRIIDEKYSKHKITFFISELYDDDCYILTLIVDNKWNCVDYRQSTKIDLNTDLENTVTTLYNRTNK